MGLCEPPAVIGTVARVADHSSPRDVATPSPAPVGVAPPPPTPAPAPAPTIDLTVFDQQISSLASAVHGVAEAQTEAAIALNTQSASLHQTIENLAQMVMLTRQENAAMAERHRQELHALRSQLIELQVGVDEAIDTTAADRTQVELRELRRAMTSMGERTPEPDTASQLAATLNVLREAGAEQISAAHLVHSFQLEIRSLRDELQRLSAARDDAGPRVGDHSGQAGQ